MFLSISPIILAFSFSKSNIYDIFFQDSLKLQSLELNGIKKAYYKHNLNIAFHYPDN